MAANLELTLPSPGQWNRDLQTATQTARVYGDQNDVTNTINLVNKYLWFALWVISMVVLVIAGIKLITARWDEKVMKSVNQLIIWLVVGIVIAIFSYLLVRLIANVF